MIIWSILGAIFVLFLVCQFYNFKTGVPTVTSFPSARRKIADILQKEFSARDNVTIIDLGSGNGQLSRRIARALPHAHVIGIELSMIPWLRSVLWQRMLGPANLTYKRIDFWPYDCSGADAVVTYLTENIIERVSQKLHRELKPGATVIANDVALHDGWVPVEIIETGFLGLKIYVYRQA